MAGPSPLRDKVLAEVVRTPGLMSLLMKQRNGARWTPDERRGLRRALSRLSRTAPILLAVALPGGLLLVPALAWWLDRRRKRRNTPQRPASQEG